MSSRAFKIRYKTWYWGKFVFNGEHGFSLKTEGFEIYNEETHGWHHSEEYRIQNDCIK